MPHVWIGPICRIVWDNVWDANMIVVINVSQQYKPHNLLQQYTNTAQNNS